jgi:hypothetical protein
VTATKTEKPILFSCPMVRAILEGRKTQTRRVVKKDIPPRYHDVFPESFGTCHWLWSKETSGEGAEQQDLFPLVAPYQVGDRLWVRETWATIRDEDECSIATLTEMNDAGPATVFYRDTANHITGKWRPSIFMPRWASRITLEVTGVRVERLQDISEVDANREGLELCIEEGCGCIRNRFMRLWDSINGKTCPWESNPWVWVYEFRRVDK